MPDDDPSDVVFEEPPIEVLARKFAPVLSKKEMHGARFEDAEGDAVELEDLKQEEETEDEPKDAD